MITVSISSLPRAIGTSTVGAVARRRAFDCDCVRDCAARNRARARDGRPIARAPRLGARRVSNRAARVGASTARMSAAVRRRRAVARARRARVEESLDRRVVTAVESRIPVAKRR